MRAGRSKRRGGRAILSVVALAVGLTLPSLRAGLYTDDYYQRWVLTGCQTYGELQPSAGALEMFSFLDGDAARTRRMKQLGLVPWWTFDQIRGQFWRPLTAATHLAEYRLWPHRPQWMHAQSIAWYAALVAAVAVLYRRMMGATVAATLAAVMFAVDDAHAIPVAFLASRNALIAATFGALALLAHRRWRQQDSPRWPYLVLAVILFAASLLAAEAGVATLGYLLAYAVVMERASWRRRVISLLPYVAVTAAWRIAWSAGGYGVNGLDDLYADPLREPVKFASATLLRLPLLMLGQWAYPPADVGLLVNDAGNVFFALIGVVMVVVLAVAMRSLLWRSRVARFWAVGMLLSTIPLCAVAASNRQLLFVGIGAFGLLGQFLSMARRAQFWHGLPRTRRLARFSLVAFLATVHLVASPVVLLVMSAWPMGPAEMWHAVQELPDVTPADVERDVIVVSHPMPPIMLHTLCSRAVDGRPLPRSVAVLAPTSIPLRVRRLDERTLMLSARGGLFGDTFSRLFYSREHPPAVNEPIDLPAVRVTVLELTPDGRPIVMRFQFRVPLEDARLKWMSWRSGGFGRFTPPAVGREIELPVSEFPF